MDLAKDGKQNMESIEDGGGKDSVPSYTDIKGACSMLSMLSSCSHAVDGGLAHTIASLLETVLRIAMRCEDSDFVPKFLQSYSGIDDQPLSPSDAQVRVEEDHIT